MDFSSCPLTNEINFNGGNEAESNAATKTLQLHNKGMYQKPKTTCIQTNCDKAIQLHMEHNGIPQIQKWYMGPISIIVTYCTIIWKQKMESKHWIKAIYCEIKNNKWKKIIMANMNKIIWRHFSWTTDVTSYTLQLTYTSQWKTQIVGKQMWEELRYYDNVQWNRSMQNGVVKLKKVSNNRG